MHSLPIVAISIGALAFVAWMAVVGLHAKDLFAEQPPAAVPRLEQSVSAAAAGAARAPTHLIPATRSERHAR